MAQQAQERSIIDAVEVLQNNGSGALAVAVTMPMNTAMASERSEDAAPVAPRRRFG